MHRRVYLHPRMPRVQLQQHMEELVNPAFAKRGWWVRASGHMAEIDGIIGRPVWIMRGDEEPVGLIVVQDGGLHIQQHDSNGTTVRRWLVPFQAFSGDAVCLAFRAQ